MNLSWIHALGWTALHSLWQAAILILAYRAVEPWLRDRPRLRYWSGLSMVALAAVAAGWTWRLQQPTAPTPAGSDSLSAIAGAAPAAGGPAVDVVLPSSRIAELVAASGEGLTGPAALIWLIGAGFASARLARAYQRCRELREESQLVTSPTLLEQVEVAKRCLRIRQAVEAATSSRVDSPVLIGWLRPRIILPPRFEPALPSEQLHAVLVHELAHVKRRDFVANLIQTAFESLFFCHPGVRWLSREIRVAREHCCDDLAAAASPGGPLTYATSLVRLEELRTSPVVALGVTDGGLLRRVDRLLSNQRSRTGGPRSASSALGTARAFGCLSAAALVLLGGIRVADATTTARTVLQGLDPVLLVEGAMEKGSPAYSLYSNGYRYLFASRENKELFRAAPGRYVVANPGYCPITGKRVRPDAWRLIDGRVVLFCCASLSDPQSPIPQSALSRIASL